MASRMLLHYPCTDCESGDLQYPEGLLVAGIDLAKDVASSPEPSGDKVSTDGAALSMHCQMLRGEAVSSA